MPIALAKTEKKSRYTTLDTSDGRRQTEMGSASAKPPLAHEPLGSDLKAKRLKNNITYEQIAHDTHLSLRHIRNLEEGRYGDLPGGMYNRAILKTYCVYLGLDPEKFLERFDRELTPPTERVPKVKPRNVQMPEHTFRIPPVLVWSVMLLASIAGVYFSRGWISAVFSPYFAQPPAARIQTTLPAPAPSESKPVATAQAPPPDTQTAATTTPVEPEGPPFVNPPAAAEPVPGMIRLEFQATQTCWISVAADANRSQSRTLQPGDIQSYEAKESFVVVLGNAGGVSLKIDGKPAKPLGKPGEVLKFQITPQNIPALLEKVIGQ